jgi:hypothetical protein
MKNNNTNANRRDVLKYVGGSSAAATILSMPVSAENDKERSDHPHTLSYDIKMRNAGAEPVNTVVKINSTDSQSNASSEHKSRSLSRGQSKKESNVPLQKGEYHVRARANFKGNSKTEAETTVAIPENGFPDYYGLLVTVFGKEEVRIVEVNV